MAPFPVDPSGGDGPGCAKLGAGGTPALPGSLHPMTSSHQGHQIAEAFWRRLWLKRAHLPSGLFVFIRVHSWFVFTKRSAVFPRMIRPSGRGPNLPAARARAITAEQAHEVYWLFVRFNLTAGVVSGEPLSAQSGMQFLLQNPFRPTTDQSLFLWQSAFGPLRPFGGSNEPFPRKPGKSTSYDVAVPGTVASRKFARQNQPG